MSIQFKKLKNDTTVRTKIVDTKTRYGTIKNQPIIKVQQHFTNQDIFKFGGNNDAVVENMLSTAIEDAGVTTNENERQPNNVVNGPEQQLDGTMVSPQTEAI